MARIWGATPDHVPCATSTPPESISGGVISAKVAVLYSRILSYPTPSPGLVTPPPSYPRLVLLTPLSGLHSLCTSTTHSFRSWRWPPPRPWHSSLTCLAITSAPSSVAYGTRVPPKTVSRASTPSCCDGPHADRDWSVNFFAVSNNLWGYGAGSGSQCTGVDAFHQKGVAWHTEWSWSGGCVSMRASELQLNLLLSQR